MAATLAPRDRIRAGAPNRRAAIAGASTASTGFAVGADPGGGFRRRMQAEPPYFGENLVPTEALVGAQGFFQYRENLALECAAMTAGTRASDRRSRPGQSRWTDSPA
jgi:hypothetical protein